MKTDIFLCIRIIRLTLRKTASCVFSWESAASRLIDEGGIQGRFVDKG